MENSKELSVVVFVDREINFHHSRCLLFSE